MHRFRAFVLLALLACAFVPTTASAALPLFDPDWHIVPDASDFPGCTDGDPLAFGAILQLIQNLMNAAVSLTVIVATLVIMYAGVLFMTAAANAENISKAKGAATSAVIGIIIVLSAWLVIDFVMKVLYKGEDGQGGTFGPWNEVLTGGDACIKEAPTKSLFGDLDFGSPSVDPQQGSNWTGSATGITVPRTGPGACNTSTLAAAAQKGNVNLSSSDASTFACLAHFESACGATTLNYRWGRGSSAAGAFQVLLEANSSCYENAACRTAAGVSGPLNCADGFKGGNPIPGSAIAQRCVNAASNLSCSIAAAVCVKQKQGFSAWTADKNSRGQQACLRR